LREYLTTQMVEELQTPGRHADGNGLYLYIDPSGARRWIWRGRIHGKRSDLGLGSARIVTLEEARTKARDILRTLNDGDKPTMGRARRRARDPLIATAIEVVELFTAWVSDNTPASRRALGKARDRLYRELSKDGA